MFGQRKRWPLAGERLLFKSTQEGLSRVGEAIDHRVGFQALNCRRHLDQTGRGHLLDLTHERGPTNFKKTIRLIVGSREKLMHQIQIHLRLRTLVAASIYDSCHGSRARAL
jgi:hypothetical protein